MTDGIRQAGELHVNQMKQEFSFTFGILIDSKEKKQPKWSKRMSWKTNLKSDSQCTFFLLSR